MFFNVLSVYSRPTSEISLLCLSQAMIYELSLNFS